ncbi:TetR family transcriptional regulator [Nocardioides albertanoniae]|uniref:TetR family transcriptional regulator n=1 Tax=Nocardioides albertanoniae TaxID=1175486 RepID=A0A543A567_9ACTN|nr:TetR/AcrR family transcriptional regulator [Nocardioides albertanoniae]TQL67687.1 TetR family transcriptional regulator [Nocardioides albertanoniae]
MDVRSRLVDSGVELLERDGLQSLTLRTIARAAGVSHGAPRHHFPTYAALLAAIAREGITDLDERLSPALTDPDAAVAIRTAAAAYVAFATERPEMFALITRHDLLEGAGGHLRKTTGRWIAALHTRLSEARKAPIDLEDTAALWASVHGLATLTSRRSAEPVADVDPSATLARVLDLHLRP